LRNISCGTIIRENDDANDSGTFYVSENKMTVVEARTTNVKLNSSVKVRVPEANLFAG